MFRKPTFLACLKKGLNISTSVAIDFSGSNKDSDIPDSLHFDLPDRHSQYYQAMKEVLSVVLDYDHEKKIMAMGFGAILPDQKKVSDCFPLTLDKWHCSGLD